MSAYPISAPVRLWTNAAGLPLNGGYIYFGTANQDPETVPTQVYWDVDETIPAAQPIRTINGYVSRDGVSKANVYISGDFSIRVRDSKLQVVMEAANSADLQLGAAITSGTAASSIPLVDAGGYFTTGNVEAALQQLGPLLAAVVATFPTGMIVDYMGTTAPAGGWLLLDGRTIGNAASNAGNYSGANVGDGVHNNAANQALFIQLWNTCANAELPIQDSTGAASSRGASGIIDFNLNKRLPLPDARGRVLATLDNLGGTLSSPARMTSANGLDGTLPGKAGGAQTHTLTVAQLAAHAHPGSSQAAHDHTYTVTNNSNYLNVPASGGNPVNAGVTTGNTSSATPAVTVASQGSGSAHNNTQPTLMVGKIIKL